MDSQAGKQKHSKLAILLQQEKLGGNLHQLTTNMTKA